MAIQKITTGVIESSQTLTTPTVSGNLSLDSTGTSGIRVPSANTLVFHSAGTERMRITSDGMVGIGITSPYTGTKLSLKNGATNTYSATGFLSGRTFDLITNSASSDDYSGVRFSDSSSSRESFFGVVQESGGPGAFVWQNYTGSGYSEKMRVDSSGRVTRPYQPCFQATGSFTPGTGIVNINSVNFDNNSNFNTSTYRFTAPVTGKYHFWGSISFYTGTSGQYVRHGQLAILKNGATNLGMSDFTFYNNIGNNQHMSVPVQQYVSLAANDYVELNVITWSASGSFTNYGCYFGGQLIG